MRPGKPTSPEIIDFIIRTVRNTPGLTAREIVEKVEASFPPTKIDSSTIGRIRAKYVPDWRELRKHGQSSSVSGDRPVDAPDAHVDDLLGWVWSTLEQIKSSRSAVWYLDFRLQPQPESGVEFLNDHSLLKESLRQHLPGSPIWGQLDQLRSAIGLRQSSIQAIDQIAAREGQELFDALISNEFNLESPRLTTSFAPAVRSRVLCQSNGVGNGSDGFHLGWQDHGEMMADHSTSLTRELQLDEQTAVDRFQGVVELVASRPETPTAISSIQTADSAAKAVSDSLERIYFRRRVPGQCDLCDPNAE